MSEMRERRERHTLNEFVVIVGNWNEGEPFVIGAVEATVYEALMEEEKWEQRKAELYAQLGIEEIPEDSLREVRVHAWIPWLWEIPDLNADGQAEEIEQ